MVPVAARCPQGKPGTARLDGQEGRQNLRHRTGRLEGERTDLIVSHLQCQFQCQRLGRSRRRRRWPTERERVIQLAVTVAISVLLYRTESSQGTAAEDEVQGHLSSQRRSSFQVLLFFAIFRFSSHIINQYQF